MSFEKIGNYLVHVLPQVEYCNPVEFDFHNELDSHLMLVNQIVQASPEFSGLSKFEKDELAHNTAVEEHLKDWTTRYREIMAQKFPENFFAFLLTEKRKKQDNILKDVTLNVKMLNAIFYRAWHKFGFRFSYYRFEKKSDQFRDKKRPKLYYLRPDNSFDTIGKTDLSDGQLKALLQQRKVVIVIFLDKGKLWHCFLHTYNSIMGKEIGNKPHLHYISSAFGRHISRESVLKELSKGEYNLPSMIHIPFRENMFDLFPEVPIIPRKDYAH